MGDVIMEQSLFFYFFSLTAILGAIGLVVARHPMNGAMSLIVTMISLSGLYALLSAGFLFAMQLIVYAGAIMSLILFIIMFLNIRNEDLPDERNRFIYLVFGAVLLSPFAALLLKAISKASANFEAVPAVGDGFGSIRAVGMLLFQNWLLPFEIVSVLLLVALVGAVVLAGKERIK